MIENNPTTDAGQSLTQDQLAKLEKQLGAPLPADYKSFLLQSNGGRPSKGFFLYEGRGKRLEYWVDSFYSVDKHLVKPDRDAQVDTLSYWRSQYGHVMPDDAIVIGSVCRDDQLLLYFRGSRLGQVHLVDWELLDEASGEITAEKIEAAIRFVAPSFYEFYTQLYDVPAT